MPRIVITSDTHLGITSLPRLIKLLNDIRAAKPDALAIAGDIGEGTENIGIALEEFKSLGIPIAACAGNHDIWNLDKFHPSELLWTQILPNIANENKTIWLENEILTVSGVAIVGSIGWYDYSAQDPAFKTSDEECYSRKREFDADAWMVDWPWSDIEFCNIIRPGFYSRLERAQNDSKIKSIIVVTHCPIYEKQIRRKPGNFKWGFSNAYYGNLTFGKMAEEFDKITHVVSGHTHAGADGIEEINGRSVRVVTLDSQYDDPVFLVLDL